MISDVFRKLFGLLRSTGLLYYLLQWLKLSSERITLDGIVPIIAAVKTAGFALRDVDRFCLLRTACNTPWKSLSIRPRSSSIEILFAIFQMDRVTVI